MHFKSINAILKILSLIVRFLTADFSTGKDPWYHYCTRTGLKFIDYMYQIIF